MKFNDFDLSLEDIVHVIKTWTFKDSVTNVKGVTTTDTVTAVLAMVAYPGNTVLPTLYVQHPATRDIRYKEDVLDGDGIRKRIIQHFSFASDFMLSPEGEEAFRAAWRKAYKYKEANRAEAEYGEFA